MTSQFTLQRIMRKVNNFTEIVEKMLFCAKLTKDYQFLSKNIGNNFEKYSKKVLQIDYNIVTIGYVARVVRLI